MDPLCCGCRVARLGSWRRPSFSANLSTPFHKYDHVCGERFSAQTRRERRAYPSGVCKARATTVWVEKNRRPQGCVAFRFWRCCSSVIPTGRDGGCSLVAPSQNRKATQQTWPYLWNGVLSQLDHTADTRLLSIAGRAATPAFSGLIFVP